MTNKIVTLITSVLSILIAFLLYRNIGILHKAGLVIIPIILCSIFGFAIAIEKRWQLHNIKIDTEKFMNNLLSKVRDEKIKEAVGLCDANDKPISRILKAGVVKYDKPKDVIKEAMEEASLAEVPKLEKNLSALATVAHISPLLGLLGTVTGLVSTFRVIELQSSSFSPVNPGDLAGGIWEALITTVAGLTVAIPMFVIYNYLVGKVNGFISEMEHSSTRLVNFISENKKK